jgi:hypothetical protein
MPVAVPKPAGADSVPPELLYQIFRHLLLPAPSSSRLHAQPVTTLTTSGHAILKPITSVSRKWRWVGIRLLFSSARLRLGFDGHAVNRDWNEEIRGFLRFVNKSDLLTLIDSLTIIVSEDKELERPSREDLTEGWRSLFDSINPRRLTIVAPPAMLGALIGCKVDLDWSSKFHMPHHILSLTQPHFTTSRIPQDPHPPSTVFYQSALLNFRPWSSLLLNEGSFVRAYCDLGFPRYILPPPSILSALVGTTGFPHMALLPSTIRSMSYIAIFPFAAHFSELFRLFSRLQALYFQILPHNDILPDTEQKALAAASDLFAERDRCYQLLLLEAMDPNLHSFHRWLTEIECGDARVDESWERLAHIMSRLLRGRWKENPESCGAIKKGPLGRE